jgi:hypothetical protein
MRPNPVGIARTAMLVSVACLTAFASACGAKGSASSGSGGTTGQGGSPGAGGAPGSGGATGQGGDGGGSGAATFTVNVTTSSAIPTVGIVTWSVNLPIDSAVINFGRDQTNFEFQAPVDLTQANYRTLLLGMKQSTKYSLQISAQGGGNTYLSGVYTVTTGFLPNGLPVFTVSDKNASALYAGGAFTVNCTGLAESVTGTTNPASTSNYAFIFDKDGDLVWALNLASTVATNCTRARMSYDGQYMWAGNFANVSMMGALYRITMDGLGTAKTWSLPGRSHDFSILPSGHVLFFQQDNGGGYSAGMKEGPDSIKELNPDTSAVTVLYDETTAPGAHTNHANYVPELQAISFSMRHISTIGLISYPAGKLLATFGGTNTDFGAMSWTIQHGHEVFSDHIWVFNNTNGGTAHVLGFTYDLSGKTATKTLDYDPGISCAAFGDVKELPNGNLWVTYSISGAFHEITQTGTLLRQVTTTTAVGYSEHRASLYGPPPPYDM